MTSLPLTHPTLEEAGSALLGPGQQGAGGGVRVADDRGVRLVEPSQIVVDLGQRAS